MKDIANPTWIKVKGILFLVLGMLSSILLVSKLPNVTVVYSLPWQFGASVASTISHFM
jgi:hypothetical protein